MTKNDTTLRRQLTELLSWESAHLNFDSAVAGLSWTDAGRTAEGAPHSVWQLVEHLRICQWDILQFSIDAGHVSPEFPDSYWPEKPAPAGENEWRDSLAAFRSDLEAMVGLIRDPKTDLLAPIPHGQGQTILREALVLADHNAYHVGQIITLRRRLGLWQ